MSEDSRDLSSQIADDNLRATFAQTIIEISTCALNIEKIIGKQFGGILHRDTYQPIQELLHDILENMVKQVL
jgi:hypothetical protein